MSTREQLLAASADFPLDIAACRKSQIIYFNNGDAIWCPNGNICVFVENPYMRVTFTYPDFEPVAMKHEVNYAHAWMGCEDALSDDVKYTKLMNAVIAYTIELTARYKKLNDNVISNYVEWDYGGPYILIKRGDIFKIPLPAETEEEDCFDELVDLAHEDPFLFDTWEEKLNILRAGLPQPIFEEIETVAVFFSE